MWARFFLVGIYQIFVILTLLPKNYRKTLKSSWISTEYWLGQDNVLGTEGCCIVWKKRKSWIQRHPKNWSEKWCSRRVRFHLIDPEQLDDIVDALCLHTCTYDILFLYFSPEMSPLKSVPQIRIDMDPDDDNTFYWKSRGSETSL